MLTDDLGTPLRLRGRPRRVISLVPSLTEAVARTTADVLIGATDFCTHPAELEVGRVGGTKWPDVERVLALEPDLVLANQEENRLEDVTRLRECGVPVWVGVVRSVDEALRSLQRMLGLLAPQEPQWLIQARQVWRPGPARQRAARAVIPIWRRPWMVVGADTFAGDVLGRLGVTNACAGSTDRYPRRSLAQLHAIGPDLVVLPDEPYAFSATDGPESFPGMRCALVSGRHLTWYGPSLVEARALLEHQLDC